MPNPCTLTDTEPPPLRISDSDSALTPLERALVSALISAIVKELQSKGLHPSAPAGRVNIECRSRCWPRSTLANRPRIHR